MIHVRDADALGKILLLGLAGADFLTVFRLDLSVHFLSVYKLAAVQ